MLARRKVCGVVLAVAMGLTTACYSFVPLATGAGPRSGDRVRVRLTSDGTAGLASILGPGVATAEGTLDETHTDGSIVVGVTSVTLTSGINQFWNGANVVAFPSGYVAGVDARALNAQRTRAALIGGGIGILAIFAIALGTSGAGGNGSAGGGQPPP